jgi:hypothetical protein
MIEIAKIAGIAKESKLAQETAAWNFEAELNG